MDGDSTQGPLQDMLAQLMEAEPEARPVLRRIFFAHATRDWATEVPAATMEAAGEAMAAMHHAMEQGDHAAALAHLRVWAGLLGVDGGEAATE